MKKTPLLAGLMLSAVLLISCFSSAQEKLSTEEFVKKLDAGFVSNEENQYIYFDELNNDHGILIIDHEYDDIDETYYVLFYKKRKQIYHTSNMGLLRKKLSLLPKGAALDWYDTCTMSKMEALSESKKSQFRKLCKSLGIKLIEPSWGESRNIVCYCNKMREKRKGDKRD